MLLSVVGASGQVKRGQGVWKAVTFRRRRAARLRAAAARARGRRKRSRKDHDLEHRITSD